MISIWAPEQSDFRRKFIVTWLRKVGKPLHLYDLATEINGGESWLGEKTFHDSHIRRILTADIDAINRDMDIRVIIKSDNRGVRLCSKEECEKMYAAEYREAVKKLEKCRRIAEKAGLNGQMTIENREITTLVDPK